jgi:hypothetical protein
MFCLLGDHLAGEGAKGVPPAISVGATSGPTTFQAKLLTIEIIW